MKHIAKIEFLWGYLATVILIGKFWWLPFVTSVLWVLGGSVRKIIRRLGVPLTVCTVSIYSGQLYQICYILPLGFAILCIGDGFPDKFSGDEGSWLGQQVNRFVKDATLGGYVTKVIPVVLLQLAWLPLWLK